jgi:hypothetical protein
MSPAMIAIRRRDPAVIAGRAHAVLDAAARIHAQWPRAGRPAMNECFISLDRALTEYDTAAEAGGDAEAAAETASCAMALLLISVSVFLGRDVADEMAKSAAGITAGGDAGTKDEMTKNAAGDMR